MWFPAQAADADLGLLLAAEHIDAVPAPAWLLALQQALDTDQRDAWEALAAELPAAGFDEKSGQRLATFIAERFKEKQ
ncbi:hypothetical protein [Denitratimonas tolerans]|uniref:Uncharacterized protein n=1 Tax=Denitratimonas tolerans TaxID=1338420 RepID=A0AAW9RCY4_9GAMM